MKKVLIHFENEVIGQAVVRSDGEVVSGELFADRLTNPKLIRLFANRNNYSSHDDQHAVVGRIAEIIDGGGDSWQTLRDIRDLLNARSSMWFE